MDRRKRSIFLKEFRIVFDIHSLNYQVDICSDPDPLLLFSYPSSALTRTTIFDSLNSVLQDYSKTVPSSFALPSINSERTALLSRNYNTISFSSLLQPLEDNEDDFNSYPLFLVNNQ